VFEPKFLHTGPGSSPDYKVEDDVRIPQFTRARIPTLPCHVHTAICKVQRYEIEHAVKCVMLSNWGVGGLRYTVQISTGGLRHGPTNIDLSPAQPSWRQVIHVVDKVAGAAEVLLPEREAKPRDLAAARVGNVLHALGARAARAFVGPVFRVYFVLILCVFRIRVSCVSHWVFVWVGKGY
jgi:hypothetical protein